MRGGGHAGAASGGGAFVDDRATLASCPDLLDPEFYGSGLTEMATTDVRLGATRSRGGQPLEGLLRVLSAQPASRLAGIAEIVSIRFLTLGRLSLRRIEVGVGPSDCAG